MIVRTWEALSGGAVISCKYVIPDIDLIFCRLRHGIRSYTSEVPIFSLEIPIAQSIYWSFYINTENYLTVIQLPVPPKNI